MKPAPGPTPQVITETIYSLHEMGKRIDEVHVITTKTGKNRILDNILDPQKGHFFKYLEEYGIDPGSIKFSRKNIYVCKYREMRALLFMRWASARRHG